MSDRRADPRSEHAVPAAPKRAWVTLLALGMLVPLALIGGVVVSVTAGDGPALWAAAAISTAITLTLLGLMRRRRILIRDGQLQVDAAFYRLRVPVADLDLDASRSVNLDEHTQLRPLLKTNGFALPGYSAGHFRLRDRTRAFCLVTDPTRVLALRRRSGEMLLLSPLRPSALQDALRSSHAG